ncbi:hypothetical protein C8R45DRAFT_925459 [Mycena sanguinolenta]|nr:hypothetical protein C8R45DRAFT_925459 [Mycena sanguinolenta]
MGAGRLAGVLLLGRVQAGEGRVQDEDGVDENEDKGRGGEEVEGRGRGEVGRKAEEPIGGMRWICVVVGLWLFILGLTIHFLLLSSRPFPSLYLHPPHPDSPSRLDPFTCTGTLGRQSKVRLRRRQSSAKRNVTREGSRQSVELLE